MNAGEAAEERADREDTESERQTCYIIRASPSSVCVTQRVTAVLLCFLASHPRKLLTVSVTSVSTFPLLSVAR